MPNALIQNGELRLGSDKTIRLQEGTFINRVSVANTSHGGSAALADFCPGRWGLEIDGLVGYFQGGSEACYPLPFGTNIQIGMANAPFQRILAASISQVTPLEDITSHYDLQGAKTYSVGRPYYAVSLLGALQDDDDANIFPTSATANNIVLSDVTLMITDSENAEGDDGNPIQEGRSSITFGKLTLQQSGAPLRMREGGVIMASWQGLGGGTITLDGIGSSYGDDNIFALTEHEIVVEIDGGHKYSGNLVYDRKTATIDYRQGGPVMVQFDGAKFNGAVTVAAAD